MERKWTLLLTYSVTVQTPKLTRRGKLPRKTFVNPVEFITNLGVKCKIIRASLSLLTCFVLKFKIFRGR